MNNPRLATRYAKSMVDLAVEQNQLDIVCNDMKLILSICKTNPDFVAVLRSPIIKPPAKVKIIESITKERVSSLTTAFIKLLIVKIREINLPEIAAAFIDQYNTINNIQKIRITTAVKISDTLRDAILSQIKANTTSSSIDLETAVNSSLIGGFVLETKDKILDASILKDLKDVGKQFLNNDYLHRIR